MVLVGTGGGVYSTSSSGNNYGLYIGSNNGSGQIIVGNNNGGATATLSGIGGSRRLWQ